MVILPATLMAADFTVETKLTGMRWKQLKIRLLTK